MTLGGRRTDGLLMGAIGGRSLPPDVATDFSQRPPAGVTLFRHANGGTAQELIALTDALQASVPAGAPAMLVATDQEGGQLQALGDFATQFAGAMALGATDDEALAERVAQATGRELRALGVNVNYAPVCDLATNPANPGLGIRSFGDDAPAAARLAAATVRGLQAEGVAATVKHFPGKGDAAVDTHHQLAVVARDMDELEQRELVPFRAALDAGARLVMSGHFALPALTGDERLPGTLARAVTTNLLRDKLGFRGVAITDALDMRALAQGPAQLVEAVAAIRAGQDLLLGTYPPSVEGLADGLAQAELRGLFDGAAVERSLDRITELRRWPSGFSRPPLEVVGCAEHQQLARELAERSITLVRDEQHILPLRPPADARLAVIVPELLDLTPADTSSYIALSLADAVRQRHAATDEFTVEHLPTDETIAAVRQRVAGHDVLIIGTVSAHLAPAQAALVRVLLGLGRPTVTLALRTPWDLASYPTAATHLCSYGVRGPSITALVGAIWGEVPLRGRLPVMIDGMYHRGHGLTSEGTAR